MTEQIHNKESYSNFAEIKKKNRFAILFEGTIYKNKKDLCKAFNISIPTYDKRLKHGYTMEEALKTPDQNINPITYKGITYQSEKHLIRTFGIPRGTYRNRIKRGWTMEAALETPPKSNVEKVEYNGKIYRDFFELANDLNIIYTNLLRRMRDGMSPEDAIEYELKANSIQIKYKGKTYSNNEELVNSLSYNKPIFSYRLTQDVDSVNFADGIDFDGKNFSSVAQVAKNNNVRSELVKDRLTNGWLLEDAIAKPLAVRKCPIDFEGQHFPSIEALAKAYKINVGTFRSRRKKGWSLFECVYGKKDTTKRGKRIDAIMEETFFAKAE